MDDIKFKKSQNNVHFYLQKDKSGYYCLSLGKPIRDRKLGLQIDVHCKSLIIASFNTFLPYFERLNLRFPKYDYLTWEHEPVEVFLNLEN